MSDSKIQVGLKKLPIHLQSSQNRILIKGGKIVNDDRAFFGDVYIEDGIIKQVGLQLMIPGGVRVIDAAGKLVLPGGIDANVHLQTSYGGLCTADDFYTGTRAAIAGGTTTIIDSVTPPKGSSLLKIYEQYREAADAKVCCDYALHVVIPHFDDNTIKQMTILVEEKGINSFKFLMSPQSLRLDDDVIFKMLNKCKQLGALAMIHAEDGKLIEILEDEIFDSGIHGPEGVLYSRPEMSEVEATSRAITMANAVRCPLLVLHVMSSQVARIVSQAAHDGSLVFGEAVASALGTDGHHYFNTNWRHAAGHVTCPPLRPNPAVSHDLMICVGLGDLQVVSSDHCVYKTEQRALGKEDFRKIPKGVNGIEDRMSVVWEKGVVTGILDPCKFVAVTSTNVAKMFNLYPRKGRIEVGSDADLVIWDPQATRLISASTHHQNVDFNIFEGMCCHGVAVTVLSGGRVVMDEGDVRVTQGGGHFLSCSPFSPYVFDRLKALDEARAVKPVVREPYVGPVSSQCVTNGSDHSVDKTHADRRDANGPRTRSPTRGGGRNMQESSFSLSGAQIDDAQHQVRTSVRTHQPPGGVSTSLW